MSRDTGNALTVHDAGTVANLPPGAQREILVDNRRILLCHTEDGIVALQALCTHAQKPLLGARILRGKLYCPHHGAVFSLSDGTVIAPPAGAALRRYTVRVRDERILVHVEAD